MNDLDRGFAELRERIVWPELDDVAARAAPSFTRRRARVWSGRITMLATTAAALFVAAAIVMAASPPARSALLEVLGIRGIDIERVEKLPIAPRHDRGVLGRTVALDEARAAFPLVAPPLGEPAEVRVSDRIPGGSYSLVYPPSERLPAARPGIGLLLTQFRGESTPYVDKLITYGARVTRVSVGGQRGYWIRGGRRVVVYRDGSGLISQAGLELPDAPLLIWERDGLALRLQAKVSLGEALRIARSVR